jgi:hypothetical protein
MLWLYQMVYGIHMFIGQNLRLTIILVIILRYQNIQRVEQQLHYLHLTLRR